MLHFALIISIFFFWVFFFLLLLCFVYVCRLPRLTSRTNAEQLIICGTLLLLFAFGLAHSFATLLHCIFCSLSLFALLCFGLPAQLCFCCVRRRRLSFHNSFPVGAGNASSTLAQVGVRVRFGGFTVVFADHSNH